MSSETRAAFVAILCLASSSAWAAPCCSAGSSSAALITSDDFARVSVTYSFADTVMDAQDSGPALLRSEKNLDRSHSTRIAAVRKISEFWQLGLGTTLLSRTTSAAQEAGFGDSDLSLGYEILPEWEYSLLQPRGHLFAQVVLPTGRALQDPARSNSADYRGQGVFQTAVGFAMTKSWERWDAFAIPEFRVLFARTFSGDSELGSGWGGSIQLGCGFTAARSAFRIGLRTQPVYQSSRAVLNPTGWETIPSKLVWNTGVDLTFSGLDPWRFGIGYSDQTLLGPARNATLERSASLMIQRSWEP